MSSFHMYLPSNTHDTDKTNDFVVDLPETIELTGDWEVALEEIVYPYSWFNITGKDDDTRIVPIRLGKTDKGKTYLRSIIVNIPKRSYGTIEELVSITNDSIKIEAEKVEWENVPLLSYDKLIGRAFYAFKGDDDIVLSKKLQYILGFEGNYAKRETSFIRDNKAIARYPPDMTAGMTSLLVYCNIVAPQINGNRFDPILRVVTVKGSFGSQVNHEFNNLHYVPILQRSFNRIQINIKDDEGNLVPFQFGKVLLKLHFHPVALSLLLQSVSDLDPVIHHQ